MKTVRISGLCRNFLNGIRAVYQQTPGMFHALIQQILFRGHSQFPLKFPVEQVQRNSGFPAEFPVGQRPDQMTVHQFRGTADPRVQRAFPWIQKLFRRNPVQIRIQQQTQQQWIRMNGRILINLLKELPGMIRRKGKNAALHPVKRRRQLKMQIKMPERFRAAGGIIGVRGNQKNPVRRHFHSIAFIFKTRTRIRIPVESPAGMCYPAVIPFHDPGKTAYPDDRIKSGSAIG